MNGWSTKYKAKEAKAKGYQVHFYRGGCGGCVLQVFKGGCMPVDVKGKLLWKRANNSGDALDRAKRAIERVAPAKCPPCCADVHRRVHYSKSK